MNKTKSVFFRFFFALFVISLAACGGGGSSSGSGLSDSGDSGSSGSGSSGSGSIGSDGGTGSNAVTCDGAAVLHDAFLDFGDNVEVVLDSANCSVAIEATGKPDHSSPYWDPNGSNAHLYEEPGPETDVSQMSPGYIDGFGTQLFAMTVSTNPELASNTTATSLGAIGIAVSGSPIFNDQEGPNVDLALGVISGFDKNGAHTGPSTYHYHLEPISISDDDYELIGIMADGFFIYGRKDYPTADYPTDLDDSGGHVGVTQHSAEPEYHYHIKNETYAGSYYLLFPEDYQGTPVNISN